MAEIQPRYEFRVWAKTLDEPRKRLAAVPGGKPQESTETYILSAATSTTNVKIRAALMDIKELVREQDGLEQWNPTLKEEFPIVAAIVSSKILPGLRAEVPKLSRERYTLDEFLREVVATHPKLKAVSLTKFRTQYKIDGCTAEFTEVRINDAQAQTVQTVAVESEDPAAVRGVVTRLGLGTTPNVNYIRELKRLAGMGG
ncbi:MAG TPA: hypothetical protein VIX59_17305 [Candidatus Binataceae bacterium]